MSPSFITSIKPSSLSMKPSLKKITDETMVIKNIKKASNDVLNRPPPNLNGFSIKKKVIIDKRIDKNINKKMKVVLKLSPFIILEKVKRIQCHRYNGKLISPKKTSNFFDRMYLFIKAFGPAATKKHVPKIIRRAI